MKARFQRGFTLPDSVERSRWVPKMPGVALSTKTAPLVKIGRGYVSYSYNYRSGADSQFVENNVAQHLIAGNFSATIAGKLPLRVSYLQRQSNSKYFKNFVDVRVDVDVQQLRQLRRQKALSALTAYLDKMRDRNFLLPKIWPVQNLINITIF